MIWSEEPEYFHLPIFENRFTSNDLDELLSFFQSGCNNINGSGLDEPINRTSEESDEKKEKRKVSNRESAKRSRGRKKRHLEYLTAQVSRLKAQNRDYRNRLSSILHQLHVVRTQNDRFRLESVGLLQRHSHLNRVSQAVQFQYKSNIVSNLSVEGNGSFISPQRYSY